MAKALPLKVEKRDITGRRVNTLRRQGILPGNVFGKDIESFTIQLPTADFTKIYAEAGETGLIELSIGDSKHPVLVSNLHVHPVTNAPLHVDFHEVNLKEKVTATVPVEMTGESPAEKSGDGTVVQQLQEIEVEALPTDLPESFIVDVSSLTAVDQAIYVKDLDYDREKVEIMVDQESIVVAVAEPQKEEVIEEAAGEGEIQAETDAGSTEEGTAETDEAENQSKQEQE